MPIRSIGFAYPISTTGVCASRPRNSRTQPSTSRMPTRSASAASLARWITGPSAIGSENGTPSSMTSAPPATSACITGTVDSRAGKPEVM